jgi:HlyD family secretion protein
MKRTFIITGIVIVVTIIALVVFNKLTSKKDEENLFAEAIKGDFEIAITTSGELIAENSIDIKAPEIAQGRDIHSANIKITDLVPEGTEVKEGDYIATLDRTEFDNSLKDERERLKTFRTNVEMKSLDTAVTLTSLRDDLRNQRHTVEEAEITLRNSKFEPPTTIRQAEIDMDKQQRILEQKERTYILRVAQAERDIKNLNMWLSRVTKRVNDFEEVLAGFVIKAPSSGMVIYKKDRRGTKIKAGSSINPFERIVATLPDLSSMLSRIYISEIEISKVKPGQTVNINVDAFPEKTYTGKVLTVANIGEKLPNTDSKVFEVMVKVEGSDPTLRPSMTTGNKVLIKNISEAISIPTECIQAEADGIPFVYTRNRTKQIVIPGDSNEKNTVIEQGLEPGTMLYLSTPEQHDKFKLAGEELIPVIKEREKTRRDKYTTSIQ